MASQELKSNSYVNSITKETSINDAYKIIYNIIENGMTDLRSPERSKWIYCSYPENDLDSKRDYPIGIVNSPDLDWDRFGMKRRKITFSMGLEMFATNARDADTLIQQLIFLIESNRPMLRKIGINSIDLDSTSASFITRGEIYLHQRSAVFTFTYIFTGSL